MQPLTLHNVTLLSIETNGVCLRIDSLSALVVAAPLQGDLDDLVSYAHVQLASAVQDQQAPNGLPLPGGEQLDLFQ